MPWLFVLGVLGVTKMGPLITVKAQLLTQNLSHIGNQTTLESSLPLILFRLIIFLSKFCNSSTSIFSFLYFIVWNIFCSALMQESFCSNNEQFAEMLKLVVVVLKASEVSPCFGDWSFSGSLGL